MKKMRSELYIDASKPKGKDLGGGGNKSTYIDTNKGSSRKDSPLNLKAH